MALRRSPPTTSDAETTLASPKRKRDAGPTTEPVSVRQRTTPQLRLRGLLGGAALAALAVTSMAACAGTPDNSGTNASTSDPASSVRDTSLAGVRFDKGELTEFDY